jgi:hypothetical protein
MTGARRVKAGLAIIALLAALIRLVVVPRQGLWTDEVFSIAIATAHSVEQPADQSRPSLGDYVESPEPQSPETYRAYLKNASSGSLSLVTRAVFLSDTSPPLYYILLHGWMLWLGSSDFSVRLFSVCWSLACLPVIFLIGRRVGDIWIGSVACLLFAVAPDAVFYSTEGRMYSLVWFLIVIYAYLMLRLHDGSLGWGWAIIAALTGAAGLLTHYFFLFPWLACTLWLIAVGPDRIRRWRALTVLLLTGILVSPWYLRVPASLGAWRITKGWLNIPDGRWSDLIPRFHLIWLLTPFYLARSFVSLRGAWIGPTSPGLGAPNLLLLILLIVVAAAALVKHGRSLFTRERGLLWLWFIAPCLGPLGFDLFNHTYTSTVPRYALAGLPAALLLIAVCLVSLPRHIREAFVVVILLSWALADWQIFLSASRYWVPFREVAQRIDRESPPPDLVIIHSIPVGVLGVARYLHSSPPIFSWVGQLQQRTIPEDVARAVSGHRKVMLVKIHDVREPAPEEQWLEAHALRAHSENLESAKLDIFELAPLYRPDS